MRTATFIMDVSKRFRGTALLYQLNPPYLDEFGNSIRFAVASTVILPHIGNEILVFRASKEGKVTNWSEIAGMRSSSHEEVFRDIGYDVINESKEAP